jgi:hypothetical protein
MKTPSPQPLPRSERCGPWSSSRVTSRSNLEEGRARDRTNGVPHTVAADLGSPLLAGALLCVFAVQRVLTWSNGSRAVAQLG